MNHLYAAYGLIEINSKRLKIYIYIEKEISQFHSPVA